MNLSPIPKPEVNIADSSEPVDQPFDQQDQASESIPCVVKLVEKEPEEFLIESENVKKLYLNYQCTEQNDGLYIGDEKLLATLIDEILLGTFKSGVGPSFA